MNNQVKDDGMGRVSSTHGRIIENHIGFFWESQKEGDH
jgi:hypothetical protein